MDLTATAPPLTGWTPIRVDLAGPRPRVDWCLTDGVGWTDPSFDYTVERWLRDPCRLLFRRETGIDEVGHLVADHPGLPPAAFIFHLSRCGSTLLARMLAQDPEHLVVSEAAPVDTILRAGWSRPDLADDERSTWLRWIVGSVGQGRDDQQRRLFVKLDAWSVIDLPLVRLAYPDVPWLFVYRDPVEVLVSHAGHPGAHMIPGVLPSSMVGMTPAEVALTSPAEYQARVLAALCHAALADADDPAATFVEYGQLPEAAVTVLERVCGISVDPAARRRMLEITGQDAKNPSVPFHDDRLHKQATASPAVRAAADRWLAPLYDRLEAARARQEWRCARAD